MSATPYLDYAGLGRYNTKIQAQLSGKVNAEVGKGLSTEDYTAEDKAKLAGLKNYVLTPTKTDTLGGVVVETTENPVPEKPGLKADASGKAFVDWTEAPKASTTEAGLIKLGEGFIVNEDGSVKVDNNGGVASSVAWDDITGMPDVALKTDITNIYHWKGSVATYDDLPTQDVEIGDVYDVEETGMNYGWTGSSWDALGQSFSITPISNEEIDALFATDEG